MSAAMCMYKGQEYSQGQEWYDGCDFQCTCYDASANLYSCTNRYVSNKVVFVQTDVEVIKERCDFHDVPVITRIYIY